MFNKLEGTQGYRLYVEGEEVSPQQKGGFIPDEQYQGMLDNTIIVCVDVVIVDKKRKLFYLAKRIVHPMQGLWCMGGRRKKGETPHDAIARRFMQETGLELRPQKFQFVGVMEYVWKTRQQAPRENGTHNMAHQFYVELTTKRLEIVRFCLSPTEYDLEFGLQPFTREDMVRENVHPALLDTYDLIFPQK